MKVLRVYHAGRDAAHRRRENALRAQGVELILVVPRTWSDGEARLTQEPFGIVELDIQRTGDINRHRYLDMSQAAELIKDEAPDLLDIHEEPFSVAARQWLRITPSGLPIVMYTAQNIDKRFPPPFAQYEIAALSRVSALYPCSRQAGGVARGKGFDGLIEVLPLGYDDAVITPGHQSIGDDEIVLSFVGRLVAEKGVLDAVDLLARMQSVRPTRLALAGAGPLMAMVRQRAASHGVEDRLELLGWSSPSELAALYASTHFVLVPSRTTETWVEQFGRVIVEGQAGGAVVAGYATGSIPDVGGDPAVIVPEGDVEALADRLTALLQDPAEFERRRREGISQSATRTWLQVGARQAALYSRVLRGDTGNPQPRSPRARRVAARAEFGPTAATGAGERPFALPFLRRGGTVPRLLGAAIDACAEIRARLA